MVHHYMKRTIKWCAIIIILDAEAARKKNNMDHQPLLYTSKSRGWRC